MSRWLLIPVLLAAGGLSLGIAGTVWWNAGPLDVRTRPDQVHSDLRILADCVELFRIDTGRYPSSNEGLAAAVMVGRCRASLRDPWGRPYQYRVVHGQPVRFEISSFGQQGPRAGAEPQEFVISRDDT
jgi:general secretion pathway protein G